MCLQMGERSCGRTQASPGRDWGAAVGRTVPGRWLGSDFLLQLGGGAPRLGGQVFLAELGPLHLLHILNRVPESLGICFYNSFAFPPFHRDFLNGKLNGSLGPADPWQSPRRAARPWLPVPGGRGTQWAGWGGASQAPALLKPWPFHDPVFPSTTRSIVPARTSQSSLSPQAQHTGRLVNVDVTEYMVG